MTRVVNLPGYRTIVVQSCIASILSASSDTPASLTMRLSARGPSPKQLEHFHCCYCRNAFSLGLPSGTASAVAAGLMYEGLRKVTIIAIVGLYAVNTVLAFFLAVCHVVRRYLISFDFSD